MDDRYFRIGYAWPKRDELREGLASIGRAIEDVRRK
jgi:DNA-binding transcriptional MocR family regulator